jgi:hypothetical protein
MKRQARLGLLLLLAFTSAALSGCSRKDLSPSSPPAETASQPKAEAVAKPGLPGKPGTSAACLSCENTPATCAAYSNCDAATGDAADGTPKSQLCQQTLDCVRDSGCASDGRPPLKFCYCGTANVGDCTSGKANGPCKAVLEKSLEGKTFAEIAQRIGNTSFGGGMAMKRIDCDQVFCRKQCF